MLFLQKSHVGFSGKRWIYVPGRLKQIESGPKGSCWGVNKAGRVYYRMGVTRGRKHGRYWKLVKGRLSYVSPGCTGVVGVSSNGRIWRYVGKYGYCIFNGTTRIF